MIEPWLYFVEFFFLSLGLIDYVSQETALAVSRNPVLTPLIAEILSSERLHEAHAHGGEDEHLPPPEEQEPFHPQQQRKLDIQQQQQQRHQEQRREEEQHEPPQEPPRINTRHNVLSSAEQGELLRQLRALYAAHLREVNPPADEEAAREQPVSRAEL